LNFAICSCGIFKVAYDDNVGLGQDWLYDWLRVLILLDGLHIHGGYDEDVGVSVVEFFGGDDKECAMISWCAAVFLSVQI
jgi:hypothetical protein